MNYFLVFSFGNNSFGQCGRPIVNDEVYLSNRTIHKINEIEDKVSKVLIMIWSNNFGINDNWLF